MIVNMTKRICAALAATVALCTPAFARVDPGTVELIRTAEQYGATFLYNPSGCGGAYLGYFKPFNQEIALCYRGTPRAADHDTVRHEVWHFVQYCAAQRRGLRGITPVAINPTVRHQWVSQYLKPAKISRIRSAYPRHQHETELEAFAAAQHYTSSQIAGVVRKWCVRPT